MCDIGTSTGPLSVGCLAGDAQSYILFCDFFDRVIEAYHSYRVLGHVTQRSDFNHDNLKVSVSYITLFVPVYVILYHSAVAFSNHKVFFFFFYSRPSLIYINLFIGTCMADNSCELRL